MNKLLTELIPYVRNGEVTLKTLYGDMRGIIDNLVVYSKAGDFFVRFKELSVTPSGLDSSNLELPCWEIIGVNDAEVADKDAKNIYLVTHGDYSDYRVLGVFTDREQARTYCRERNPDGSDGELIRQGNSTISPDYAIEPWYANESID